MQNHKISDLQSSKDNSNYQIKLGLTDSQINQLIEYSKSDQSLAKFTSDPHRFASRENFDEFSTHIMAYYSLVDENDNLLGIIWFDNFAMPEVTHDLGDMSSLPNSEDRSLKMDPGSQIVRDEIGEVQDDNGEGAQNDKINTEDYGISFAIRLYNDARGQGLSLPFAEKSLQDFITTDDYNHHPHRKLWLAVSPDNIPAIKTYEKIGFQKIGQQADGKKDLMILNSL